MAGSRLTVLHASDLQCGRPFVQRAADALARLAPRIDPDVIVVAGDLTQRAKAREFETALAVLASLPDVPVVTTPGNHDVPLYRVWERFTAPFGKWRRHVSARLDTVTEVEGATLVALNSAAPRRAIVNGRLDVEQMELARRVFAAAPADDVRVLVVHHHFVPVPSGEGGPPLPSAPRWLEAFEEMGVDVVLGGHVHQLHIRTSRDVLRGRPGPGVPVVACGTTTSRRGRGGEAGWNSLTEVRVSDTEVVVVPHKLAPGASDFEAGTPIPFPRARFAGSAGVRSGEARS